MEENWRDVPGYEGLYQISIDTPEGRCRKIYKNGKIKELSNNPKRNKDRIYWKLWKDNDVTQSQAARWIALTYPELIEGEYFENAVIDHKDTNPMNNQPSNLHWVTQKENCNNPLTRKCLSNALSGKNLNNPSYSKTVCQYSNEGILIAVYPSAMEAQRQTGINRSNILSCCNKRRGFLTAGGYVWKYAS